MAEYKAPGVYVEEIPSSVRPIGGVGTSTAGFIGRAALVDMAETPSSTDAAKDYYLLADGNDPKRITSWEEYKRNFGDFQPENEVLSHAVYGFFNNGGTACWIARAISTNEVEYGDAKAAALLELIITQTKVAELESEVSDVEDAATVEIAETAYAEVLSKYNEIVTSVSKVLTDVNEEITGGTDLTEITLNASIYPEPATDVTGFTTITEFQDEAAAAIKRADALYSDVGFGYVAQIKINAMAEVADYEDALETFEKIDEIAIVAAPGVVDNNTKELMLTHCENLEDRFAILDGNPLTASDEVAHKTDPTWVAGEISGPVDGKSVTALGKSANGYGAIYYPWIQVSNPLPKNDKDKVVSVPPSGHMAGIYARSDANRGVHKTPANEIVRGALGVDYKLCKADHAVLNVGRINAIRSFNGSITVYGGRTYSDNSSYNYISTRRLMNAVSESIEEGTQWTIFEPNDQTLWKKIRRNVTAYLTNVWREGALFGETPADAFYVKCDEETNPEDSRALGKVVTEIGVATVKPAEFVVFRISHS